MRTGVTSACTACAACGEGALTPSALDPLAARRFPPVRTFGLRHAAMPVTDHEFFGRSAELEQIRRTLHLEAGAVVVLAAGGMGKTRFALRFAELYGDEFDGGVWFCDLSAAQTLEGLLREVARALGLALVGASVEPQIEQIGFALAGREEALFLFDNVEQVARARCGAAALAQADARSPLPDHLAARDRGRGHRRV